MKVPTDVKIFLGTGVVSCAALIGLSAVTERPPRKPIEAPTASPMGLSTSSVMFEEAHLRGPTSGGAVDLTLFRVPPPDPQSINGKSALVGYGLLVRVVDPPTGPGTVHLRCGTGPGGDELLQEQKVTAAVPAGRVYGVAVEEIGVAFRKVSVYAALLDHGTEVTCRATADGTLTWGGLFDIYFMGMRL